MMNAFPPNMRTPQAACYLQVSESLLEKLRVSGGGPRYSKLGRGVIYRRAALDAWLASRETMHTSQPIQVFGEVV